MIKIHRNYRYKGYIFGTVFIDGEEKFYSIEKYFNHLPPGEYDLKVLNKSPLSTFAKFVVNNTKKFGSDNPEDDIFFGKRLRYCYVDDIFEWEQEPNIFVGIDGNKITIEGEPDTVAKSVLFDEDYFHKVTQKTRYKRYE